MHRFHVVFQPLQGVHVDAQTLRVGTAAASRALSSFDDGWMARLQPLAFRRREELDGVDYLDSSVLVYALFKALEAAYPTTGGEPPPPLTRESFVLRIFSMGAQDSGDTE